MTHWSFHPILDSYAAVALLTVGLLLLLMVGPNYRELRPSRRATLIALRLGVILLLVLAMLRPTRVSTTREQQSATLLVLFDVSRSMSLPSGKTGLSRWEVQTAALRSIEGDLRELADDVEIKVYAYDQQLRPAGSGRDGVQLPAAPEGEQTDLGGSLYEAVQGELGKRLIGVLVLGDGTQTAFDPKVEIQQAAREVARIDAPLYAVAIGPVGDAAQSRDVVVDNLPEQYTVFVKNELPVKGTLRVRGYVDPIPVRLLIEAPGGEKQTLGPYQIAARPDGQPAPVEVKFVPETPGQYKITLQADAQPGELVTRNNALSAYVNVLEGGLRVLYLYGDLLGEQQKLRESIGASPDIQVDDVFIDPGRRDQWPVKIEQLESPDYDVLILESVDAAALAESDWRAIAQEVEQGKGLIMIGGYHSFGPGGFQGTPLADVLPVEMGRFERQDFDRPVSRDLHLWGELSMVPQRDHPVVQLAAGENNRLAWESLPSLQGANKFTPKPTGLVLAATADGQPLLVSGQYGGGRVLAAAANSTIRWWRYGRQSEHRRFWRQVVLWLASREDLAKHDVWIKLDQRRFNPGSPIPFTAGAQAPTGEPVTDADLQAELVAPDGTRTPIPLSLDGEQYAGRVEPLDQPGDYLLNLTASRGGRTLGTARTSFQVLDRDVELSNPAADYDLLARLANQTSDAGGRPLAPEQLPSLLDDLKSRRENLEIEVETKWTLGDTTLDAWLMVLSIVGLLTGEWVLRKKWGLV